jgi:hypothetical protein
VTTDPEVEWPEGPDVTFGLCEWCLEGERLIRRLHDPVLAAEDPEHEYPPMWWCRPCYEQRQAEADDVPRP